MGRGITPYAGVNAVLVLHKAGKGLVDKVRRTGRRYVARKVTNSVSKKLSDALTTRVKSKKLKQLIRNQVSAATPLVASWIEGNQSGSGWGRRRRRRRRGRKH